jgi:hypothetical protein
MALLIYVNVFAADSVDVGQWEKEPAEEGRRG